MKNFKLSSYLLGEENFCEDLDAIDELEVGCPKLIGYGFGNGKRKEPIFGLSKSFYLCKKSTIIDY